MGERNPSPSASSACWSSRCSASFAYNADALPLIGGGTTYTADFTEAAGLRPGNEVRVAGVKVGEVTGVALDGARVKVTFKVKNTWIGDASTAAIGIKTLLGEKYLALDPLGTGRQDPGQRIPASRTTSPYDVTQAFKDSATPSRRSTPSSSPRASRRSPTPSRTPRRTYAAPPPASPRCRAPSPSATPSWPNSSRAARQLTKTLKDKKSSFETLIEDGNLLLGEIQARRDAIHPLLTGTQDLGTQLNGLVDDNRQQLGPTLDALGRVTGVLLKNRTSLDQTLALAGPYYRLVGNTLGNGRWFDSYLCGLVPKSYLPPGTPPDDRTACRRSRQAAPDEPPRAIVGITAGLAVVAAPATVRGDGAAAAAPHPRHRLLRPGRRRLRRLRPAGPRRKVGTVESVEPVGTRSGHPAARRRRRGARRRRAPSSSRPASSPTATSSSPPPTPAAPARGRTPSCPPAATPPPRDRPALRSRSPNSATRSAPTAPTPTAPCPRC